MNFKPWQKWIALGGTGAVVALGIAGLSLAQDQTTDAQAAAEKEKLAAAQQQQTQTSVTRSTVDKTAVINADTATSGQTQLARPVTKVAQSPIFVPLKERPAVLERRPMKSATVNWKAVRAEQQKETQAAPQQGQKQARRVNPASRLQKPELDKTRLPVVLPREGGLIDASKARMMSKGNAYAITMPQPSGMKITTFGHRSRVQGDKGAVTAKPFASVQGMKEAVQITRMEDGWTATFERFGVVYSIDLLCDNDVADCQSDAFIRKAVAEFSEVALGTEAEKEAEEATAPEGNWFDQTVKSFNKMIGG